MSPERRSARRLDPAGLRADQRRFREIFPGRFRDETYIDWERTYKWQAHELWCQLLAREELDRLLRRGEHREVAARALAVYARPKLNLLALYEWMALREALTDPEGARRFAPALRDLGRRPRSAPTSATGAARLGTPTARCSSWPETCAPRSPAGGRATSSTSRASSG